MSAYQRALRVVAGLVVAGALGAAGLYAWFVTHRPDADRYPVMGIDVSHHNGDVDWRRVAGRDVEFVYLKATEGGDFKDRRFQENWSRARQSGFRVGAYHFFTLCRSGAEQAKNFIDSVPVASDSLPPVVDLEFGGNCSARPSLDDFRGELRAYLDAVEARYGRTAVLYVTQPFDEDYLAGAFAAQPRWVRSIIRAPQWARGRWTLWQFHNRGRVDGVDGPVDLNVFNGSRVAFLRWVQGTQR